MANNCINYITIQGKPELIEIVARDYIGYNKEEDEVNFTFEIMCPIPDDTDNDYAWRIDNWGNKWDGSDNYIDICDDEIHISVDTAWSPCDKWTYKLIELCPGLNIYHEYYEPGCGFIGWIQHNDDEEDDSYEEVSYYYGSDNFEYWVTVFEKEYENFDWLRDHIEEMYDCGDIIEDHKNHLLNIIDEDYPLENIISDCIEYDVL